MKNNKLHKVLSEKYNEEETLLDKEAFWNELEPELPQKKKRRFLFFIVAFSLMAMASVAAYVSIVSVPNGTDTSYERNESKKKDIIGSNQAPIISKSPKNNTLNTTDLSVEKDGIRKNNTIRPHKQKTDNLRTKNTSIKNAKNQTTPSHHRTKYLSDRTTTLNSSNHKSEHASPHNTTHLKKNKSLQPLTKKGSPLKDKQQGLSIPRDTILVNELDNPFIPEFLKERELLTLDKKPTFPSIKVVPQLKPYSFYSDYIFFNQSIQSTSPELDAYAADLNNSLSEMFGFSTGIKKHVHLSENWSFSGGIEFMQLNEKFERTTIAEEVIDVSGHSKISSLNRITNRYVFHTNHNNHINIPLSIDHSFKLGKLNFMNSLGYTFNVFKRAYGKYIDQNGNITAISHNSQFLKNRVPGFIDYKLQLSLPMDRIELGAHIGYANQVGSRFSNSSIQESLNLIKAGLNVRYSI